MTTRQNKYARVLRDLLIVAFGGCCQYIKENGEVCGSTEELEFAHIEETGLTGRGRGLLARVYDVLYFPWKYSLFCKDCHRLFDGGKTWREN